MFPQSARRFRERLQRRIPTRQSDRQNRPALPAFAAIFLMADRHHVTSERCAFSHKSVISVTRRRKEQRFCAAQAAQRKPDGPAGLPDLESPTRHSDASKPNAQRTTGGFSNLTWKNSCSSASGTEHAAGATKKRTRSTSPEKQISPSAPQGRSPIGSSAASRSSVSTDTDRAEGPISATRPRKQNAMGMFASTPSTELKTERRLLARGERRRSHLSKPASDRHGHVRFDIVDRAGS